MTFPVFVFRTLCPQSLATLAVRVNEGVVLLRRRQLLPLLQTGLRDCEATVRSAAAKALATLGPQVGQEYILPCS